MIQVKNIKKKFKEVYTSFFLEKIWKCPTRTFPRLPAILLLLMSRFLFSHRYLSIGVTARQGGKLASVFGKIIKNFSVSSIRAGARHRHPDDRAAISHPLYSVFFGKRSEKNGLFFKKVLIPSFDRPVHTQKITKRSPLF